MKKELIVFKTAVMFFTRIPVGKVEYAQEYLNQSNKYLPVIGWIVGGSAALSFMLFTLVLPVEMAVILSMAISILLTGAFHEDGFADLCDGFGGGWTTQKIMEIMKDSRVGAFGVIGLITLLLTKVVSLSHVPESILPVTLLAGHTFSRYSAVLFIFSHEYVRDDHTGKSKPIGKKLNNSGLIFASITALLPFLLFPHFGFLLIIPVIVLIKYLFARYISKTIGGYTGDCLGALQQVTETSFYILIIVFMTLQNTII